MSNHITRLKKISIEKFRGLEGVDIEFGNKLTIICGKNGTSKSTLLGVAAQIFSFKTDYSVDPELELDYRSLFDQPFESNFGDHFRFSQKYDNPQASRINIDVYDGAFKKSPERLQLSFTKSKDRKYPRPVVRHNVALKEGDNTSRNVTHPVMFLSLSRLIPISERENYFVKEVEYIDNNRHRFIELNQKILNKSGSSNVTATKGDLNSVVSHGVDYDHESVSVGEDNVGQLTLALMSFEKLKNEYKDYHGGMLLIDEADAGLFPAAQVDFIELLTKLSRELDLQVVMTSHSPVMIKTVYDKAKKNSNDFKVIFLSDSQGPIRPQHNWSWEDIEADLKTEMIATKYGNLPEINLYFEDDEAFQLYKAIVRSQNIKKCLKPVRDTTIGSNQYKTLISKGVKEFSENSVVAFDGDVSGIDQFKTSVKLPGTMPPDQLIFEYLLKLPKDHDFWKAQNKFDKPVFTRLTHDLRSRLKIDNAEVDDDFDLLSYVKSADRDKSKEKVRVLFKKFYQTEQVQALVKGKLATNPLYLWSKDNVEEVERFKNDIIKAQKYILKKKHGFLDIDTAFLDKS